MADSALYDRDFHAWSQEQARKVREGSLDIDRENIAEELALTQHPCHEVQSNLWRE